MSSIVDPMSSNDCINYGQKLCALNKAQIRLFVLYLGDGIVPDHTALIKYKFDKYFRTKDLAVYGNLTNCFKAWAEKLTLSEDGSLVVASTKKKVLPLEDVADKLMTIHTNGHRRGPNHIGFDLTCVQFSSVYAMGCKNFGVTKEHAKRVLKNCRSPHCRSKVHRATYYLVSSDKNKDTISPKSPHSYIREKVQKRRTQLNKPLNRSTEAITFCPENGGKEDSKLQNELKHNISVAKSCSIEEIISRNKYNDTQIPIEIKPLDEKDNGISSGYQTKHDNKAISNVTASQDQHDKTNFVERTDTRHTESKLKYHSAPPFGESGGCVVEPTSSCSNAQSLDGSTRTKNSPYRFKKTRTIKEICREKFAHADPKSTNASFNFKKTESMQALCQPTPAHKATSVSNTSDYQQRKKPNSVDNATLVSNTSDYQQRKKPNSVDNATLVSNTSGHEQGIKPNSVDNATLVSNTSGHEQGIKPNSVDNATLVSNTSDHQQRKKPNSVDNATLVSNTSDHQQRKKPNSVDNATLVSNTSGHQQRKKPNSVDNATLVSNTSGHQRRKKPNFAELMGNAQRLRPIMPKQIQDSATNTEIEQKQLSSPAFSSATMSKLRMLLQESLRKRGLENYHDKEGAQKKKSKKNRKKSKANIALKQDAAISTSGKAKIGKKRKLTEQASKDLSESESYVSLSKIRCSNTAKELQAAKGQPRHRTIQANKSTKEECSVPNAEQNENQNESGPYSTPRVVVQNLSSSTLQDAVKNSEPMRSIKRCTKKKSSKFSQHKANVEKCTRTLRSEQFAHLMPSKKHEPGARNALDRTLSDQVQFSPPAKQSKIHCRSVPYSAPRVVEKLSSPNAYGAVGKTLMKTHYRPSHNTQSQRKGSTQVTSPQKPAALDKDKPPENSRRNHKGQKLHVQKPTPLRYQIGSYTESSSSTVSSLNTISPKTCVQIKTIARPAGPTLAAVLVESDTLSVDAKQGFNYETYSNYMRDQMNDMLVITQEGSKEGLDKSPTQKDPNFTPSKTSNSSGDLDTTNEGQGFKINANSNTSLPSPTVRKSNTTNRKRENLQMSIERRNEEKSSKKIIKVQDNTREILQSTVDQSQTKVDQVSLPIPSAGPGKNKHKEGVNLPYNSKAAKNLEATTTQKPDQNMSTLARQHRSIPKMKEVLLCENSTNENAIVTKYAPKSRSSPVYSLDNMSYSTTFPVAKRRKRSSEEIATRKRRNVNQSSLTPTQTASKVTTPVTIASPPKSTPDLVTMTTTRNSVSQATTQQAPRQQQDSLCIGKLSSVVPNECNTRAQSDLKQVTNTLKFGITKDFAQKKRVESKAGAKSADTDYNAAKQKSIMTEIKYMTEMKRMASRKLQAKQLLKEKKQLDMKLITKQNILESEKRKQAVLLKEVKLYKSIGELDPMKTKPLWYKLDQKLNARRLTRKLQEIQEKNEMMKLRYNMMNLKREMLNKKMEVTKMNVLKLALEAHNMKSTKSRFRCESRQGTSDFDFIGSKGKKVENSTHIADNTKVGPVVKEKTQLSGRDKERHGITSSPVQNRVEKSDIHDGEQFTEPTQCNEAALPVNNTDDSKENNICASVKESDICELPDLSNNPYIEKTLALLKELAAGQTICEPTEHSSKTDIEKTIMLLKELSAGQGICESNDYSINSDIEKTIALLKELSAGQAISNQNVEMKGNLSLNRPSNPKKFRFRKTRSSEDSLQPRSKKCDGAKHEDTEDKASTSKQTVEEETQKRNLSRNIEKTIALLRELADAQKNLNQSSVIKDDLCATDAYANKFRFRKRTILEQILQMHLKKPDEAAMQQKTIEKEEKHYVASSTSKTSQRRKISKKVRQEMVDSPGEETRTAVRRSERIQKPSQHNIQTDDVIELDTSNEGTIDTTAIGTNVVETCENNKNDERNSSDGIRNETSPNLSETNKNENSNGGEENVDGTQQKTISNKDSANKDSSLSSPLGVRYKCYKSSTGGLFFRPSTESENSPKEDSSSETAAKVQYQMLPVGTATLVGHGPRQVFVKYDNHSTSSVRPSVQGPNPNRSFVRMVGPGVTTRILDQLSASQNPRTVQIRVPRSFTPSLASSLCTSETSNSGKIVGAKTCAVLPRFSIDQNDNKLRLAIVNGKLAYIRTVPSKVTNEEHTTRKGEEGVSSTSVSNSSHETLSKQKSDEMKGSCEESEKRKQCDMREANKDCLHIYDANSRFSLSPCCANNRGSSYATKSSSDICTPKQQDEVECDNFQQIIVPQLLTTTAVSDSDIKETYGKCDVTIMSLREDCSVTGCKDIDPEFQRMYEEKSDKVWQLYKEQLLPEIRTLRTEAHLYSVRPSHVRAYLLNKKINKALGSISDTKARLQVLSDHVTRMQEAYSRDPYTHLPRIEKLYDVSAMITSVEH